MPSADEGLLLQADRLHRRDPESPHRPRRNLRTCAERSHFPYARGSRGEGEQYDVWVVGRRVDRQGLADSQDEHAAQGRSRVGEHLQQVRSVVAVRRLQGIRLRTRRWTTGSDGLREGGLAMARIPVTKTPKVYVGGQFIRSES